MKPTGKPILGDFTFDPGFHTSIVLRFQAPRLVRCPRGFLAPRVAVPLEPARRASLELGRRDGQRPAVVASLHLVGRSD